MGQIKEVSLVELREKVVAIWLADGTHDHHDECYKEYFFREFLRGYYNDISNDVVKFIECEGGGEGGAEACHSVIRVEGVYYKVFYSYYSHHGYDWDYAGAIIVNPVDRVVTFYE